MKVLPALQQIEAFSLQMKEAVLKSTASKDASTALIVNPFSVRKRGKLYGSLYEYHRNDNFDARNFFDPVGQPLPEFKRNQFGISLGAIVTGKMKVFGSYDGLRIVKGSTLLSLVPTPEMKRGDFSIITGRQIVDPFTGSAFPDNKIPEERIHTVSAKLLSLFPDPNRIGDATAGTTFSISLGSGGTFAGTLIVNRQPALVEEVVRRRRWISTLPPTRGPCRATRPAARCFPAGGNSCQRCAARPADRRGPRDGLLSVLLA